MLKSGKQKGFTLIELMLIVMIVVLFLSVAYKGYKHYLKKPNTTPATPTMVAKPTTSNYEIKVLVPNQVMSVTCTEWISRHEALEAGIIAIGEKYNLDIVNGTAIDEGEGHTDSIILFVKPR